MVITDHGGPTHARIGVDLVNPDIVATREEPKDLLVFQGLEWNIPAAEHGTVFVHPGRNEVAVLKEFENRYDGSVVGANPSTPANEALAQAGIQFLGTSVRQRRIDGALFLANHPARRGRRLYAGGPTPESFPGFPAESYRTWGGFDWFTATVGGLWDSLLAEGRPWWITANSDSHFNTWAPATAATAA
jgi:hypothetical protein